MKGYVCISRAFKYQTSPNSGLLHFVMGWTPGLVWSFLFPGWECTCCLYFPWSLYGIIPTSPSAPVHFCILSWGSTLFSGFGFCSDRSRGVPTNFFSHPLTGMVGTLLHFFIVSLLLHLLPLCLLFFLQCWLQCMPGSPHYKFMSFGFL